MNIVNNCKSKNFYKYTCYTVLLILRRVIRSTLQQQQVSGINFLEKIEVHRHG